MHTQHTRSADSRAALTAGACSLRQTHGSVVEAVVFRKTDMELAHAHSLLLCRMPAVPKW